MAKFRISIKNNTKMWSSKIEILAKNRNFLPRIEILAKNRNFGEWSKFLPKLKILPKIEIFDKNRNFCQESEFWSKIEFFAKNRNFFRNRNFGEKSIFAKNWNFDKNNRNFGPNCKEPWQYLNPESPSIMLERGFYTFVRDFYPNVPFFRVLFVTRQVSHLSLFLNPLTDSQTSC